MDPDLSFDVREPVFKCTGGREEISTPRRRRYEVAPTSLNAVVEAVMADTVATASLAALDYVAAVQADTLIADGMPEELVELANEKLAAINDAYDRVMASRGIN